MLDANILHKSIDHIQGMVFKSAHQNLIIYIPPYMLNISILVSDCSILFVQASVMFILYATNCHNI